MQFLSRNIGNHHPFQVLYLKCSYLRLFKQYAMLNMGISINSLKRHSTFISRHYNKPSGRSTKIPQEIQNISYPHPLQRDIPPGVHFPMQMLYKLRSAEQIVANVLSISVPPLPTPVSIPKSVSYGTSTGGPLSKYHANVWSRFTSKTSGHDEHVRRIPGYHIDVGKLLGNKPWTTQAPVSKPFSNNETLVYWLCFIAAFKPSICQKSRRADKRSLQNNLLKTCAEPPLPDH